MPPAAAFAPIRRIGGDNGWYAHDFLWKLRGWLDLLVGGVGLRRGRRDPETLHVGDAVDFWRVERFEPDRLLLPAGRDEGSRAGLAGVRGGTRRCGRHHPADRHLRSGGLFGLLYWYALFPVHGPVFSGMLRGIADRAESGG